MTLKEKNEYIEERFKKLSKNDPVVHRDYMSLSDKKEFRKNLLKILTARTETHTILFATFTFETTKNKVRLDDAERYFRLFRLKLDDSLLENDKQFENRPLLILFPEKSKARTPNHYHGFALIHNSTLKKFHKNCVEKVTQEPIKKLDNVLRETFYLKSFLLKSRFLKQSKKFKKIIAASNELAVVQMFKNIPDAERSSLVKEIMSEYPLIFDNHKLHKIDDLKDFLKTSIYSTKSFLSSEDDYIVETKEKQRPNPKLRKPTKSKKK